MITAAILLFFAGVVYLSAKKDREKEFYSLLKKEAVTKVNLFLNAGVDTETLQNIYRNNRKTINEVEVAVYDPGFHLLYHDAVDIDVVKESRQLMENIMRKKEVAFFQDKWQVVGLRYEIGGKTYIVTAAAFDQYGYTKLENLLRNSLLIFTISLLFIVLFAMFFTNKALNPVKEMIRKAQLISASNLDLRIVTLSKGDELAELAETFNDMLRRLEKSFESQKSFVSSISHELRTPLSAMIVELELALSTTELNRQEYRKAIGNALSDTQKLVRLSNSLLDLAKASYDPSEITFKTIRLDEVLLDATRQVQQTRKDYKIELSFKYIPDTEKDIQVYGNEYLLKVAFVNLIENACKFSPDHTAYITIDFDEKYIHLIFQDNGIGIAEQELPHIFTTFYRGANQSFTAGHGIGLPLTKKIIDLHHAEIQIVSVLEKGTSVKVIIPKGA